MIKPGKKRNGSAIITAIGMGVVLLFVIAAVYTFSSHRIQTVMLEGQKVKALAVAEAGIELVINELINNPSFETHETTKEFEWKAPKSRDISLKDNADHNLKIERTPNGTYKGTLGDGKFKVRVGLIPYLDDPDTKTMDESRSYLRVEALGRFDNTIRKIDAVINKRFPAREFLMYDGGFLSLVYGEPGLSNKNVFSTGHLYGHLGVEIGRIMMSAHSPVAHGTTQELDNMNAIISGAGGIFFYSPIRANFRDKRGAAGIATTIAANSVFPTNGTYENPSRREYGEYPVELNKAPPIDINIKPWVKDVGDGISMAPRAPSFEDLRTTANTPQGLFFAKTDNSALSKRYKMPKNWTKDNANHLDAIILDFGSNLRDNKVTFPNNFNGVIYSEKDIVIKGNPPRDISIVSEKNVFVAGDFNQSGDPGSFDEFYGLPQDYPSSGNALTESDYDPAVKSRLTDDISLTSHRHHVAAKVIAQERIVYDYRSPIDCFENELFPYMKYELARQIAGDTAAEDNCLKKNRNGIINAGTDQTAFEDAINTYFEKFPIEKVAANVSSTPKEDALKAELLQLFNDKSGQFNFDDLHGVSRKIWDGYVEKYESSDPTEKGALSNEGANPKFGVYGLLKNLRAKLGVPGNGTVKNFAPGSINDQPGDFLHFPELTTNGMFISCGELNNRFYAGPDYIKLFNKIGLSDTCVASNIGLRHSETTHFVHRVYGSEINLRTHPVHRISGGFYIPPTRRKIYDESLPRLGMNNSQFELASYIVISWRDTVAFPDYYDSF